MPLDRLKDALDAHVAGLEAAGTTKGSEAVVVAVKPAEGTRGPRFLLRGEGDREFIRMNSNSYMGLGLRPEVMKAEEAATAAFGAGPGAVRFISGTYQAHVDLEARLAAFHGREAAMIFSSAYATVVSTITPLVTPDTVLVSDELNHNCIINAMRLARPVGKAVYPHNDVRALEAALEEWKGKAKRAIVVTDGIFSMRGDHAPLDDIMEVCARHDGAYEENVVCVVDDSHGVGGFGKTGRGTEEYTNSPPVDILVGTLGKAFGVNGGYVTSSASVIRFLRESSQMYIYSNPITVGEAAAALKSLEIVDSAEGRALLDRLRGLTRRFEAGLGRVGIETIPGEHPVVPLMIRDTQRTRDLVRYLYENGVLVTGLAFPVVPRGDEEIRAQVNADHTEADIDHVLGLLEAYQQGR
ncbi:MAG: aminotransferase class I/II-fold pyridoxal phosphate-dependent enzyme [Gemmatimonadota bacterium]|nr:aminotransferase class I/II-fold pyridoxal phosphate-dependent enzyme [Gemmatimonadota bacterium]MDH5759009.1 aminotransferase class I/II-fold pyridoxal phosphate-dependent enzyme [Gemmatimonadota bacterium]